MSDRLDKAIAAFQTGALDEAEAHARATLEAAPDRAQAYDILAAILERKGQTDDAVAVLQRATGAVPDSVKLHNSLALLLARLGRMREAEDQLRYAIGFDPDQPELAANLGVLLASSGKFAEADAMLRQAIARAPGNPRYHLELGRLNLAGGRPNAASAAFGDAIKLGRARVQAGGDWKNDAAFLEAYHGALAQLAGQAFNDGNQVLALMLLQEAIAFGGGEPLRQQFANYLSATTFREPHPELKPMIVRALREAWILSGDLVRAATPLVLLEAAFQALLRKIDGGRILSDSDARAVASDPLLLAILNEGVVTDPVLERVLTALRAALLTTKSEAERLPYRAFAVLLANQCFANEYAFAETAAERAVVEGLEQAVQKDDAVADWDIALLAAYRPLNRLAAAERLLARTWSDGLEPLITRQLREPAAESALASGIPRLTAIDDPTSRQVQQQYEENPFPRWIRTPLTERRFTRDGWLRMHFPHLAAAEPKDGPLEILVAGCGTGQDAIGSAQRFAASNVLAVDLSLPSLAYAARKTAELGLGNIAYAQADILALQTLDRRFDIVECAGVLHHLADPIAGWRVLSELCTPGGVMLMALYSEQGRQDLRPVAQMASTGGYGTSATELRRFRADVLALPAAHPVRAIVSSRDDFYSLSMLRDLVFHVREHRFTIPMIADAVRALGLEFCGFGLSPADRNRFQALFGADADLASFELWHTFERENPATFAAMYHFAVRMPVQT